MEIYFYPAITIILFIASLLAYAIYKDKPLVVIKRINNLIVGNEKGSEADMKKKHAWILLCIVIFMTATSFLYSAYLITNSSVIDNNIDIDINLSQTEENHKNKVDINKISSKEFQMLIDGVGVVKAQKFETIRKELNGFKSIYDLVEYNIIGKEVYNEYKDQFVCGDWRSVNLE